MADAPLPKPQAPSTATSAGGSTGVPAGIPQPVPSSPPPSAVVPPPPPGIPQPPVKTTPPGASSGAAMAPPPAPPKPTTPPPPGVATANGAAPSNPTIQQGGAKKEPIFAKISKSPFKFVPIVLGVLVVLGIIGFIAMQFLGGSSSTSVTPPTTSTTGTSGSQSTAGTGSTTKTTTSGNKVTLTYWGLWEASSVFEDVLADFKAENPTIDVNYVQQKHPDYRERLQTAIASQNGPDLFRYHASWTPMLANELAAMPSSIMSVSEYRNTFYPVAAQQLQVNGQIVGIPLMYDGLALYYNKDILETAGLQPAQTWAALKTQATQLTVRSSDGIERAGLAVGNASNVDHFSDIIGLLMLQNGADLTDPTSKEAQEALQFYTNFVKADNVWSEDLPNSTVAFARGEVAMMFAPSWRVHEIQAINPDLNFGITQVPSLGSDRVAWATYWAEGVNSKSSNKTEAWKLLKYLSSAEVMKKLYNDQSQTRAFGEPYSRVDLADELASDPFVAPYLSDAPYATSWYLNSMTFDNGINDQLIKYYVDAVNAVLDGRQPTEVMETVDSGTTQVLRQYGAN
jgi:multiple sugar transport system substrate-binding protein